MDNKAIALNHIDQVVSILTSVKGGDVLIKDIIITLDVLHKLRSFVESIKESSNGEETLPNE